MLRGLADQVDALTIANKDLSNWFDALKADYDKLQIAAKTERDTLTERVKALEADAERYQLLSNYLISDDCQHDDAIVAARTVDQLNAAIAAMKEPR